MKKQKLYIWCRDLLDIYFSKRVSRSSAALAYYLTLSIFPLLICVSSLLSMLHVSPDSLRSVLTGLLPLSSLDTMMDYLEYVLENRSTALFIGGLVLLVTSSAASYRTIYSTITDIQGAALFKGFWGALFSFVFSIIFLSAIYASMVIVFTGRWFLNFLNDRFGIHAFIFSWDWFRFLLLALMLFLIICLVYRLCTPVSKPSRPIFVGAVVTTVVLVGVSILFSYFIGWSARYPLVYGSIASVIVMMVWFYLCGNVLIMGNAVNFLIYKYKKDTEVNDTNE